MEIERKQEEMKEFRKMEEKEEEIDLTVSRYCRDEEYEETENFCALSKLEEMDGCCPQEDAGMRELIERQKEILRLIKAEKAEFAEEFNIKMREERRNAETEREELTRRISGREEEQGGTL